MPVSSLSDVQATGANCLFLFSSRFARMGPGGEVPWRRARDRGGLERLLPSAKFQFICPILLSASVRPGQVPFEDRGEDTDDHHGGRAGDHGRGLAQPVPEQHADQRADQRGAGVYMLDEDNKLSLIRNRIETARFNMKEDIAENDL